MLIPWSVFWERNYFAEAVPALRIALTNNYVRGAVSGLGIVNIVFGLIELSRVLSFRKGVFPSFEPEPARRDGPIASPE